MKVVVTEIALERLEQICEYILGEFGMKARQNFEKIFWEASQRLAQFPDAFPKSTLIKGAYYVVLTKHNTAYYIIDGDTIAIITIFDTRQHPEKLKKNL